jgi:hypothetical protein
MRLSRMEIGQSLDVSGGRASVMMMQAHRANLSGKRQFAVEIISKGSIRITRTNPVLNREFGERE